MVKAYGLQPSPGGIRDYDYHSCFGASGQELPDRLMLPIDRWADVLDQGSIPACVAFAIACAKACHHTKDTGERVKWSPGYIYGSPVCRTGTEEWGMYLDKALLGCTEIGFVPLEMFDILVDMPQMKSYVESRPDLPEIGKKRRLKGFVSINYALESKKAETMKLALLEHQVPLIAASYDYFGVGHAFVVYGWDDSWEHKKAKQGTQIFAMRNSWGEDWEDGGNGTIPVTYLDQVFVPIFDDMPMPFEDVKEGKWFYEDVRKAAFSGLFRGVTENTFEPYGNLMRGDLAMVLARALNSMAELCNAYIKTLEQKGIEVHEIQLETNCNASFCDVSSLDYYHGAIQFVNANGIMYGVGEDYFEPQRGVKRCELAAILCRAYDYAVELLGKAVPSVSFSNQAGDVEPFLDVAETEWYYPGVLRAAALDLMQGDGEGVFRPEGAVIRAEASAVFNRLFKLIDIALAEVG